MHVVSGSQLREECDKQSGKQTVKLSEDHNHNNNHHHHHHPWTSGKPARQFNVMQDTVNALAADGFISLCAINLTFQFSSIRITFESTDKKSVVWIY